MLKPKNPLTANTFGFQLKLKAKTLRERQTEKIERERDRESGERDRETGRQRK